MSKNLFKYRMYGRRQARKKNNFNTNNKEKNVIEDINSKKLKFLKKNYNILDIGSGSGESTLYLNDRYPDSQIIACDNFKDGNINLSNKILSKKLNNIIIFNGNVLELIDKKIKENTLDSVWILFPDPWPKKRHSKRRLISIFFIKKLSSLIKKNGHIHIAIDTDFYLRQVLMIIHKCRKIFLWENQGFESWEYDDSTLPKTKYYKKAMKFDRIPFYINLKKL